MHLIVVRTRAADLTSAGELVTRYWHPGRRAWQEQTFESPEHAMHLFVEENGWELRQQQPLDRPGCEELIFAAGGGGPGQPRARGVLLGGGGVPPQNAQGLLGRGGEGGGGG